LFNDRGDSRFNASGGSTAQALFAEDNSILSLNGICVDTVDVISPSVGFDKNGDLETLLRDDWDTWRLTTANSYGDRQSQREAFFQCLVIGRYRRAGVPSERKAFWEKKMPFLIEPGEVPRRDDQPEELDDQSEELDDEAIFTSTRLANALTCALAAVPRYFVTETGYMGRGPKDVRPGDLVCIFLGGKGTPYHTPSTGRLYSHR